MPLLHRVDAWWCATGTLSDETLAEAAALLSPGEHARADRFRFARDRRDFIAAHALVRSALSAVDGRTPSQLEFSVTPSGKPILLGAEGRPSQWAFSLTHTRGLVACAVGPVAVGVDAEEATRDADVDGVAARFFAAAERDTLLRLPEGARRDRFFELWTLKESLLKALGLGLSHPLEDLAFTISPTGSIGLESRTVDAAAWRFALHRVGHYCLSVAVAHTAGAPPLAVRLTEAQLPLPRSVGLGGT